MKTMQPIRLFTAVLAGACLIAAPAGASSTNVNADADEFALSCTWSPDYDSAAGSFTFTASATCWGETPVPAQDVSISASGAASGYTSGENQVTLNLNGVQPGAVYVTFSGAGESYSATVYSLKVDIEQTREDYCIHGGSDTLDLTAGSYLGPGTAFWYWSVWYETSGRSYSFSKTTPCSATVLAEAEVLPTTCFDTCEVNIVKVDLAAEGCVGVATGTTGAVPRKQITINMCEPTDWDGSVELLWTAGKVKVYTASTEGDEVTSGAKFANTDLPTNLWVEGTSPSASTNDVVFRLNPVLTEHPCPNAGKGCDQGTMTVLKVDLTAEDSSTYPSNNVRKATAGQTLYLVAEEEFQTQKATITATAVGGLPFGAGEPIWAGQTAGNNGHVTVEYSGWSGDAGIVSATAWAGTCSDSVNIAIVGVNETSCNLIPGANTLEPILEALSGTKAFPGASLTAEATFTVGGSMWTVEKPNSPLTTKSYSGNIDLAGTLSGRIWAPPPWSGQFPPGWLQGDPWMLWQLYASATIGLTVGGQGKWLNEYNPSKGEFDGSSSLVGDVEAGVYAVVQVPGYTLDGGVSANAGVKYNFSIEGTSPNKKLMGQWETQPVSLEGSIKCVRDSDGHIVFDFEASYDVWDGWTQNPKTLIIGQPANPGQ